MNNKILKLAGPSILANITVPLVGMADLAIAGRLGDAAAIGGIAIGTMLFDLLYWNLGFLRVGTGGKAAQAYGRRDFRESINVLVQSLGTALIAALFLLAIQYIYIVGAFAVLDTTPVVEQMAREYFFIRIWAAPATLTLFSFKGWFIGMQNTVSPMITDIIVNISNILLSILFAFPMKMGIAGIALGTVTAQYIGLGSAIFLMNNYYKKLFKYINIRASLKIKEMKEFFVLNGNLFLRSASLLLVYSGFTALSARYGEELLAVSTIMMKLMLLYSYLVDGFAYAGEALAGRYIGARDILSLKRAVRLLFVWTFVIAAVSTIAYMAAGETIFGLLTNNREVIEAASPFMPWLLLVPVISCVAFMWDGIYIGATASSAIRNTMIISAAAFFIVFYATERFVGIQALYLAYSAHLIIRSVMMTVMSGKEVFGKLISG
ncbi:MAG: MATE family efflux transporter [Bacteroidales bacterium]|nr:MATE family efflux transporter [Bacteroidales bacterium]